MSNLQNKVIITAALTGAVTPKLCKSGFRDRRDRKRIPRCGNTFRCIQQSYDARKCQP